MKDFNVMIKVRNNKLLQLMRSHGHNTVASLCRECNIMGKQNEVGEYLNLKRLPYYNNSRHLRPVVKQLSEYFKCLPDDMFPENYLNTLEKNSVEIEFDQNQIINMLSPSSEKEFEQIELKFVINNALDKIQHMKTKNKTSDHDRDVLIFKQFYGLLDEEEKTFTELAKLHNLSISRISDICRKIHRYLRHPSISKTLKLYLTD